MEGFKLANGQFLICAEAPGGIYNAAQLKKISTLCEADVAIIKATEDQRLALMVSTDKMPTVIKELTSVGLGVRPYQTGLHQPTACLGQMCPMHEQDALGAAMEVSATLSELKTPTPTKIGINGCSRSCVPTHTLDISVIADSQGYRISLGGKTPMIAEMAVFMAEGVPAGELPKVLRQVVEVYAQNQQGEETLQETMERVGSKPFVTALAPYSQDAAGAGEEAPAVAEAPVAESAESSPIEEEAKPMEELAVAPTEGKAMDEISLAADVGSDAGVDIDPAGGMGDVLTAEIPIQDVGTTEAASADEAVESSDTNMDDDFDVDEVVASVEAAAVAVVSTEEEGAAPVEMSAPVAEAAPVEEEPPMTEIIEIAEEEVLLDDIAEVPEADASASNVTQNLDDMDEETYEEELNKAIEENAAIDAANQDTNDPEREAALDLVAQLPAEPEALPESAPVQEDVHTEEGINISAEEISMAQQAPLPSVTGPGAWALTNLDLSGDGSITLQFDSGAEVCLSPEIVQRPNRQVRIAGNVIQLNQTAKGVEVVVDGVRFTIPHRKAA